GQDFLARVRAAMNRSLTAVFCLLSGMGLSQTPPLTRVVSVSPDRRYALLQTDGDAEPSHTFSLENRHNHKLKKLFDFGRHADAIWSPDSKQLAITAWSGSDSAEVYILSLDDISKPLDLVAIFKAQITSGTERNLLFGNDHVYFQAVKWLSPRRLKV